MIAGGVESMSRAPFVMGKAETAFARNAAIFDTTIGWRFVNPAMKKLYGTALDAADRRQRRRRLRHRAAPTRTPSRCARQQRWAAADAAGRFADEIVPVRHRRRKRASRWWSTATSIRAPTRRWRCWPA